MNDKKRPHPPLTDRLSGEEYLSRLYQETPSEVPSPGLDVTILDAARRAVRQKPRRVYFLTSRKWAVPLSLAAAFVVTVGVVRLLRYEIESPSPVPSSIGARSSAPLRADERGEALHKRREQQQSQDGEAPVITYQEMEPLGKTTVPDPKVSLPPSTPKLSTPAERQVFRDAPKVRAQEQPQSLPLPAKSPSLTALSPGGVADQSKENVGAAAGDPQQETSVQEQQKNEGVTSSLQTTERVFHGASASGGRKKMQIGGAKKDKTSPDELSLDEWIAGIKKLRRAGKLTEAEASLKAFKQRYPDYPIEKALAQERR